MEEDWEQLSEREKVVLPIKKPVANKWDGEDEEEEVKDSWEDEDEVEEKKDEEKVETPIAKPKKTLHQKIVEREKQKLEELERRKAEQENENMTPEQKLAEKLRLQKLQEESDLKTAMETFGVTAPIGGIDGMHPTNKEEFTELADAITKKLSNYRSDPEYPNFLEDLVTKIFASLPSANIRKVKGALDNLFLEKQKLEKGDKPKKSKGGKVKARLRMDGENTNFDEYPTKYDDYDEFDDFM
ncbi:eukaryotic translation initiation factor 3 subunit J [Topomyia yanbarensis]|uniref:eukaryotic translation initiation factor 3 subunit J n=1 Tax=Topomyia yanbarensis TaxID=2498891 RepID=UPI00273B1EB1|nr:eukaryotic translation initiation factor 3 subunit J [Topomyia yanbarensis]